MKSAGAEDAPAARVAVLVPAAGHGRRMGSERKPFLELAGEPVLARALGPFLKHAAVVEVVVALHADDVVDPPGWLAALVALDGRLRLVAGGSTRTDSVRNAMAAVGPEADVLMVHDAARPLLTKDVIDRCLTAVAGGGGAVAGWPVVDTIKETDTDDRVVRTLERSRLWAAQTPQAFPRGILEEAYRRADEDGISATDDAALVERVGGRVTMVEGTPFNLKVTHPEDLGMAEAHLKRSAARPGRGTEE